MNSLDQPTTPTGVLLHPVVRCECGCSTFTRITPMRGRWIETLEWEDDGTLHREATTDGLEETATPKTIRCDKCGKRRPNPEAPNDPSSPATPKAPGGAERNDGKHN